MTYEYVYVTPYGDFRLLPDEVRQYVALLSPFRGRKLRLQILHDFMSFHARDDVEKFLLSCNYVGPAWS